jgi:hypothetical protein
MISKTLTNWFLFSFKLSVLDDFWQQYVYFLQSSWVRLSSIKGINSLSNFSVIKKSTKEIEILVFPLGFFISSIGSIRATVLVQ